MDALAFAPQTTSALIAAGAVVVGGLLGGLITVVITRQQNQHATAERKATAAADRRTRAAAILGRARVWLTDADPDRVAFNVNPEVTPKHLDSLAIRLNVLRDEISIFAAAEDDPAVMGAAARMEVALFNTYNSATWLAGDLIAHRDSMDSLTAAKLAHLRANALVRVVLDRVRGREVAKLEALLQKLDTPKVRDLPTIGELEAAFQDLDKPNPA